LTNIKAKASDFKTKIDMYERFLGQKRQEYENRNYVNFLTQTSEIEKIVKLSEKLVKESSDLLREKKQQRSIEFI